jgi:2,5-dioxopentanoate dehydrogenase
MNTIVSIAEATSADIDRAVSAALDCSEALASAPGTKLAQLLETIALEIEALGDPLLECASTETGLPLDRLRGERTRTTNQLRMFAAIAAEGAWKHPHVDPALPDRKPAPRADLRLTRMPIGPVAVWAASNFPLAFSVAGGDTASALAAGCPVIVKAHPGHPRTSAMTAQAVAKAVASTGLPAGAFSLLQGASPDISLTLVRHPGIAAGTFTGSLRAGRALFDAAVQRPVPIPFFAEMGSVNPIFLLPEALQSRGETIASGLFQSVTLGVGQFCTCPGLVIGVESPGLDLFAVALRNHFESAGAGKMLTDPIAQSYHGNVRRLRSTPAVSTFAPASSSRWLAEESVTAEGFPVLFEVSASDFLADQAMQHEVFGPATILVRCPSADQLMSVARSLEGSLTATIHASAAELKANSALVAVLARKAGRLVHNGFPTGVEVCASMNHGGPYPATTDSRFTSVGAAAIERFARPLCYQDFPPECLPAELQAFE